MWTDKLSYVTLPKSPLVDFRMRKSTKGRIKPYGYNLKQPILGLSSLTSQPKSGRDSVKLVKLGETYQVSPKSVKNQ